MVSTWLLRLLSAGVALLSWHRAQRIGAILGLLWFHVMRIRRRTVFTNLACALPERAGSHREIARDSYRNLGISALEFLKMRGAGTAEVLSRVRLHGIARFEEAHRRGRGVIVVTAHFGNFDLLACSQALRGVPLAIVSRFLGTGGFNRFWMETRQAKGLAIIPDRQTGSIRRIISWLRQGKVLGLVVDQRTGPDRGGVLSPFLACRAWTTTVPARLALRTGAAVLPVRLERCPDGDHDLYVDDEIEFGPQRDESAVQQLTDRINGAVSSWIQTRPDHWMWLHRRFAGTGQPALESRLPNG